MGTLVGIAGILLGIAGILLGIAGILLGKEDSFRKREFFCLRGSRNDSS